MASSLNVSSARPGATVVLLTTGFFGLVMAVSAPFLLSSYLLLFGYFGRGHDRLAGVLCSIGAGLWILAIPPLRKPRLASARIDASVHPELFERVGKLAQTVGVRMPEEIFLTGTGNASVTRRWMGLRPRWILELGLPFVQAATISELDAALVHRLSGVRHEWQCSLLARISIATDHMTHLIPGYRIPIEKVFEWYDCFFCRISVRVLRDHGMYAATLAANTVGSDMIMNVFKMESRVSSVAERFFLESVQPVVKAGFIPPLAEGLEAALARFPVVNSELQIEPESRAHFAAIEALPCCAVPDNRSAMSLLTNVTSLEYELVQSLLGINNKQLKPIAWEDVGVYVWLQEWLNILEENQGTLNGIRLQDIFDTVTEHLNFFGCMVSQKSVGPMIIPDSDRALHVLGSAFACSLHRARWTIDSKSGIPSFRKGDLTIDPFELVYNIASGDLTREKWNDQIETLGLAPKMPLYRIRCNQTTEA